MITKRQVTFLWIAALIATTAAAGFETAADQGRSDRLPPDRTTPVLKAMTARQRAHARHFTKSQLGSSRMLDELQSVDVHEDGWVAPTQPTLDVLADLACASDAVLSGHVRSVQSFPTEDGRFLFSEYAVEALRVFRSMSRAGTRGTVLTVIRLGGEMTIDGRPVTATISSFPALSTNRRYLLFLKYHSDTDTFETASPAGTLEIRGPYSNRQSCRYRRSGNGRRHTFLPCASAPGRSVMSLRRASAARWHSPCEAGHPSSGCTRACGLGSEQWASRAGLHNAGAPTYRPCGLEARYGLLLLPRGRSHKVSRSGRKSASGSVLC
jgi:hypothetical protein